MHKHALHSPSPASRATSGGPRLAATKAAATPLAALVEGFFVGRKPLKGSPHHTEGAYRRDLAVRPGWR